MDEVAPAELPAEHSPACWLCSSSEWGVVLRPEPFALLRCQVCGLVRTVAQGGHPEARYDASYYSARAVANTIRALNSGQGATRTRLMDYAYAAYLDRRSAWLSRAIAFPVRNRLGGLPPRWLSGSDLLDVGSGDGDFLRRARANGYRGVGQDINPAAVTSARAAGLEVRLGELDKAGFAAASFDAARLWHVLEHVPDPLATLTATRSLLKPNGVLVVGVPDYDSPARRLFGTHWSGLQLPFHRHHFTRSTLRQTLAAAGFRVRSVRSRSVGTIYSSVVGRRRPPRLVTAVVWVALLTADNVLDAAGLGDTLEAMASPT